MCLAFGTVEVEASLVLELVIARPAAETRCIVVSLVVFHWSNEGSEE